MAHRRPLQITLAVAISKLILSGSTALAAKEIPIPKHPPAKAPAPEVPGAERNWFVGLSPAYWHYAEPGLMREFGKLYGFSAAYVHSYAEDLQSAKFEFDFLGGTITYDGRFQDPPVPVKSDSKDRYWLLKSTFGWNKEAESFNYAPYIGFAFRSMNDRIQGTGGYERNILQIYIPLGVELKRELGGGWTGAILGEIDVLLSGTVTSHLEDAVAGAPTIENHQSSGFGYHFALTARYPMTSFTLRIQPYFQYWRVDDSDIVPISATQGVMEPSNKSRLVGLRIGAEF